VRLSKQAAFLVALMVCLALTAGVAIGTPKIVETGKSRGIGTARVGMTASACVSRLGKPTASGKDTSYDYTVWWYAWGKKKSGRYPLKMYARIIKSKRTTFQFDVNSSAYVSTKGVKVGSTEEKLTDTYGDDLHRTETSVYTYYTLPASVTGGPKTDFIVKDAAVKMIFVRK
jgi:hypothetical protein